MSLNRFCQAFVVAIVSPFMVARVVFGISPSLTNQNSTSQLSVPVIPSTSRDGEDNLLCFIRISGKTIDLQQLCSVVPGQGDSSDSFGNSPLIPSDFRSTGTPSVPLSKGTGASYQNDTR
ncbi:MAG: hypothetical protein KME16_10000 [Scytolyngbya sp. HA4215-MV1]|nr:hypothetical protein [Scytolyngbya sp. HA4215-MV1]